MVAVLEIPILSLRMGLLVVAMAIRLVMVLWSGAVMGIPPMGQFR